MYCAIFSREEIMINLKKIVPRYEMKNSRKRKKYKGQMIKVTVRFNSVLPVISQASQI